MELADENTVNYYLVLKGIFFSLIAIRYKPFIILYLLEIIALQIPNTNLFPPNHNSFIGNISAGSAMSCSV